MSESEHFFAPLNWSEIHTNIPVMMNCNYTVKTSFFKNALFALNNAQVTLSF